MILTGETRSIGNKTCLCATLSTTKLTWIDLESNPALRGEKPATNPGHGMACEGGSESTFLLFIAPRFPKELCFEDAFQASVVRPGKSNVQMKVSHMERWRTDSDRGKRNDGGL